MKTKLLLLFIIIGCRPDKGQNEKGAYKLDYKCVKWHYETQMQLTHIGDMSYFMPVTIFVCDIERIDTTYITLKQQ